MAGMANLDSRGLCNIKSSIQIAQLALKHRQNKNGGQRIIVFVGSPLEEDEKSLVKIGKQLKKNNVSDILLRYEIDDCGL